MASPGESSIDSPPLGPVGSPLHTPPEGAALPATPPTRGRAHVIAGLVLAAVGAALFASSYQRWGHPIIDLGRDLYLPSQILEGRVLYRELLYNYGPLPPYLLALVVAVLGDTLPVFEGFGIAVGIATLGALYATGHRLGGCALGFSAALLFLVLSFFANSTWGCNFVLPYAYAATLGTALSLWSFYFLLRYLYDGRRGSSLAVSVGFLFGAVFAKQEVGLGIALLHGLAWWAHGVPRRSVLKILGLALVLGLVFVSAFAQRGPEEHALLAENLAKFVADPVSAPFFQMVAGLDRPQANLFRALESGARVAAVMLLAFFGSAVPRLVRQKRWGAGLASAAALGAGLWLVWSSADVRLFQATPLLALAVAGHQLVRNRRDPLLLLAAYTLFSAPRVLLQFHPMWYGFYLVVPAYAFLVYALGRRLAGPPDARPFVVAALVGLSLLTLWRFERAMWESHREMTIVLVTPKGTLRDYPVGRAEALQEFLDYAAERFGRGRPRMVVFPEGVSLNYFADVENPTAYYLFTPPEIGSPAVERRILDELHATRPEYVVITSRDVREFGRRQFGVDYALGLGAWIEQGYVLERGFGGGASGPWRLVLLRRRDVD